MFDKIQAAFAPYAPVVLIVSALLVFGLLALYLTTDRPVAPTKPNLDWETAQKLSPGLPREEVRTLLGVPPGKYVTQRDPNDRISDPPKRDFTRPPGTRDEDYWEGTGRSLQVWYDADGKVIKANYIGPRTKPRVTKPAED